MANEQVNVGVWQPYKEPADVFTSAFDNVKPGESVFFRFKEGAEFYAVVRDGSYSGRKHFLVVCYTCKKMLTQRTTGPVETAKYHLPEHNQHESAGDLKLEVWSYAPAATQSVAPAPVTQAVGKLWSTPALTPREEQVMKERFSEESNKELQQDLMDQARQRQEKFLERRQVTSLVDNPDAFPALFGNYQDGIQNKTQEEEEEETDDDEDEDIEFDENGLQVPRYVSVTDHQVALLENRVSEYQALEARLLQQIQDLQKITQPLLLVAHGSADSATAAAASTDPDTFPEVSQFQANVENGESSKTIAIFALNIQDAMAYASSEGTVVGIVHVKYLSRTVITAKALQEAQRAAAVIPTITGIGVKHD